ncbi:MAG: sensor histidine kinase [Acidobacteriaceae bacterium]
MATHVLEKNEKSAGGSRATGVGRAHHDAASMLAHDTRNWLTALQVYCDLLQTSGAVDARYQDWIDELAAAVGRGQSLVLSLLDAVAQVPPTLAAVPAPVSPAAKPLDGAAESGQASSAVARCIERMLPMLRLLAGPEVHMDVDVPKEFEKAALPEGDLDRILHNLVINAVESMPQGGDLRISLSAAHVQLSAEDEHLCPRLLLCVSDTGTGIAPTLLPHVFESGVSSKKLHRVGPHMGPHKGRGDLHGFGLAAVRELTASAGGRVRVQSEVGRGTTVEVELPVAAALGKRQTASVPPVFSLTMPGSGQLFPLQSRCASADRPAAGRRKNDAAAQQPNARQRLRRKA